MARGRRKVNTDTLDAKIEQQKSSLEKAKAKYEAEKEALAELMEAVIKSECSYAEIMAFIKSAGTQEE